jgi:hypothetical protein
MKKSNRIPLEIAQELCYSIRTEAEQNWHTAAARWCWSCQQANNGDLSEPGFLQADGNRGCMLVNSRYQGEQYPV